MTDINHENTDLLDKQLVSDYLSFVAPVPYVSSFYHRDAIYEHAANLHFKIDEYNIRVDIKIGYLMLLSRYTITF